MHCKACNVQLSDVESVLKCPKTLQYLDMCRKCLDAGNIEYLHTSQIEEFDDDFDFDEIDPDLYEN